MTDDREALIKENQRLLNSSRRWRAAAIAALVLVFVVMLPFTIGVNEVVNYFSQRDEQQVLKREYEKTVRDAERMLREKGDLNQ